MAQPKAALTAEDDLWDPSWQEAAGEGTIKERERTATPDPAVDFYCSWFCPFAQRAWIALEESRVPYRYIEINPYEVDPSEPGGYTKKALPIDRKREVYPDFIAASPRGLVPAVDHDGKKVWESLHVVEYVDAVFGDGALVTREDPHTRALLRIWSDHCTERVQKTYYTALMDQDESRRMDALEKFYAECRALADAMDEKGPFFLGKRFSLVDVALAPFWQRFIWVGGHYRNLQFPKDKAFDRLHHWWEATSTRPSVAATLVCQPRLVSSYSHYARNIGTSDFSKNMQAVLSNQQ